MIAPTIAPEALRPQVEGDFASERVKQAIMANLFGEPLAPAKIGRFTVIRELGRGGTGVVYAAYDEELERKVAVKLLHPEAGEASEADARTRLMREAQAMARLSHPNIVSVHEVGTHHSQVYIAMEFVHGVTLSAWLKKQARPWREVVDAFRQAAAGLAAAHEAGLVHRDFKPQNAMIGDDGRVRVLDFGLARAESDPQLFADLEKTRDSSSRLSFGAFGPDLRALDVSLTVTGSLVGTPAYMAPEQFRGERADARSDQFALCVALYEALFRARPFPGDSLSELMRAVLLGHVRDPGATRVPRALRAAVLRGLQIRPENRHPSMDALIAALDRVVEPARGGWFAAAGLAAALAAGAGVASYSGANGQVCEDRGAAAIAAVWSPERAAAIGAALRAVDPEADEAWSIATDRFDRYAAQWAEGAVDACEAAEVRREQSPALYELRRGCLDDRLRAFSSALDLFSRPEPILAVRASDVAAGLEPLETCADPHELQRQAPPPADPEGARVVADLRAELARAEAYRRAGQLDAALAGLDALVVPADYGPLRAEYELTRGRVLVTAGRPKDALLSLQSAYFLALKSAYERLAIAAAIELVQVTGVHLADFVAAERWVRHAQALLARGGSPGQRAALADVQGQVELSTGRLADAHAHFRRALEIYDHAGLAHLPEVAVLRRILADAATSLGDLEAAQSYLDTALVSLRREYCDRHPELAAALHSSGMLALRRGDAEAALVTFARAREGIAGVVAEDSHLALQLAVGSVEALLLLREFARAESLIRSTLEGATRASVGLPIDARPLHPELFRLRNALADVLRHRGDLAAAEAEARATLADAERAWGPDEPYLASVLQVLASVLDESGHAVDAVNVAERAYALAASRGDRVQPALRYNAAFRLAHALAGAGQPERAETVAGEARALAAAAGDVRLVAAVDAWLAGRRRG